MTTVTTTFTSDSTSTERALVKLQSQVENLTDKLRKMGQESKKAAKESDDGFGAIALSGLKGYAAGLLTIGSTIGIVTAGLREWKTLQKEIAEGQIDIEKAAAGESFRNGGTTANLDSIGLARGARSQLFGYVRGDAPDLSDQRAVEIAARAAGLVNAGVPLSDVQGVASFAGQLGEVSTSLTSDDALDLAVRVQQSLRGDFGKVQADGGKRAVASLQKTAGYSLEEALGIVSAAAKNDVAPKTVEQLAALASGNLDARQGKLLAGGRRAPLSPEDAAFNRFVETKGARERVELALTDELVARGVLGDAGGVKAGLIGKTTIDAEAAGFLAAQRDNLAEKEIGRIRGEYGGAATALATEAGADAAREKTSPVATALENAARVRAAEEAQYGNNPAGWLAKRFLFNAPESFNQWMTVYEGGDRSAQSLEAESRIRSAALQGDDALQQEYNSLDASMQSELQGRLTASRGWNRASAPLAAALQRLAAAAERGQTPSINSRPESTR